MSIRISLENCFSCNRQINPTKRGAVSFPCPSCGSKIIRCADCRRLSNIYKCPGCEFEGP